LGVGGGEGVGGVGETNTKTVLGQGNHLFGGNKPWEITEKEKGKEKGIKR